MEYTVTEADDGRYLREVLRGPMALSYSAMKSAKWSDRIRLNGVSAKVDIRVRTGDTVTVLPAEEKPVYTPKPYDVVLNILYEDEHLLVINKPAPLASQSSVNHPDDSLENAVYSYMGCPEGFVYRPVNRLDKGTSGIMVVAKNAHVQHLLQQMLHTDRFVRSYLAVTEGIPEAEEGILDFPIDKAPGATIRRIVSPEGKPSVTHYRVLRASGNRALIALKLETGRTHQIRVHLSHIGCPVCGDFLYGTELPELKERFALHSAGLSLVHPVTGQLLNLRAELPGQLEDLLKADQSPNRLRSGKEPETDER